MYKIESKIDYLTLSLVRTKNKYRGKLRLQKWQ